MIKIQNLSYIKNGKFILKNITSNIRENCITGILGPNGSGKTTLLNHLIKEIKSKNKIFINNRNIEDISRKEFSKMVSFVEQNMMGIEELTVEEIIIMGRYPYKKLFCNYTLQDKKIVEQVIEKFSLSKLRNKKLNDLSGGELKRAFIAKAFVQETDILVLDEPINHLDIKYQLELMNFLKNMKEKTIIFSIHSIDLALKFCDEIILIKNGEIIIQGKTKEVLVSEKIKKTFEIDVIIKNIGEENIVIYPFH